MKHDVHRSVLTALLAAFFFFMGCEDDNPIFSDDAGDQVLNTNFWAEKKFTAAMDVINHTGLNVEGINGTIVITEVSGISSVEISARIRVESESTADAEKHLAELQVDVQDGGKIIFVRTVQPERSGGRHYIVDYTITLPKYLDVSIRSVNGIITLNDIYGNLFVKLINGEIHSQAILPLDGTINMKLINGSIGLDIHAGTSAKLSAITFNGNVDVSGLTLQDGGQTSRTVHGTCGDGRGNISLKTYNGNIRVTGF